MENTTCTRKRSGYEILQVAAFLAAARDADRSGGGCRTAPIYNVYEVPVITTHTVKLDEIKKAIIRAGASLGWEMKPVSPGHIIGTLHLRSHTAVVDVTYNPQTYSIVYKDSVNLKYSGGQIHRNYNGWIQNLDRNIKAQLGML